MGRPYISAYQIAIRVQIDYPATFAAIGKPVGGAGQGQGTLAQYIGQELARRIKGSEDLAYVAGDDRYFFEGGWLSYWELASLMFQSPSGPVEATPNVAGYDLAIFRLRRQFHP
jgi:hypothetical protein